ncbi:MAG: tRNA (adenosine(37)-N6)-threonylcarbamoyltransferase complex dimerization subunit type 1 TsaB [Clostridia bacterium]|nr:tRNA (adenosine(37)-N6)-threonylcarbamoyltransferase complex dimerization subunit type 1 TsaB [Clostridia bacterium]
MKILGIDSSAKSASAAITDDGKIISYLYTNTGLTHSQTLMPMIDSAIKSAGVSLGDIDLIAVNNGPGSFTGVRIGVASAKGISDASGVPCIGISTLESMAYNFAGFIGCIICAVMDARCSQVYTALFEITDNGVKRLTDDEAISIAELEERLKDYETTKILVGDGAELCYNMIKGENILLAGQKLRYQDAVGVCGAAENKPVSDYVTGDRLVPVYLRLPQAQRELSKKLHNKG